MAPHGFVAWTCCIYQALERRLPEWIPRVQLAEREGGSLAAGEASPFRKQKVGGRMCSAGAAACLLREGGDAFLQEAEAVEGAIHAKVAWVSRFKPKMPGGPGVNR